MTDSKGFSPCSMCHAGMTTVDVYELDGFTIAFYRVFVKCNVEKSSDAAMFRPFSGGTQTN